MSTHKAGKRSKTNEADCEEDSSPVMYDRFFVIKLNSSSAESTISKLSPFALEKSFKSAVGTAKDVKRLRDGNILMKVASVVQSQNIVKLQTLVDCPVTVTPHRSLNICKGVIRCRDLIDCDRYETLYGLKSQGVVNISNITVKMTLVVDKTPMLS